MAKCAILASAPANGTAVTAGGLTMRTNDNARPARAPRGARAGGGGTAKAQRAAPMIGALVLLATVQLMVVLDTTIVNVALPTIQASVGFSAAGIAWVVNGYALTFGALLLLGGRSGDLLGRRNVFMASPAAVSAAPLGAPVSSSPRAPLAAPRPASAGLGLIVFALSRAAAHGWTGIWTAGPLAAGAAALAAFVLLERRSAQPLTPLWVFADRNRGGAYLIQALVGGALFGMFFLTTLFLQHVLGYSPLKAGAAFVPATPVMMGAAGAMSPLVNPIAVPPPSAPVTPIAPAGMWWLSHLHLHAGYLTGVMLPLMVLSVGLGLTFVPLTLTAVSGVKEEHSGLVSGVSTTAIQIGGSIRVAPLATPAAPSAPPPAPAAG